MFNSRRTKSKAGTGVKIRRLAALTLLLTCMFTTVAWAFVTDYEGDYGNATLEVTYDNGLRRAIAETVPYTSRSCYYGKVTVTTTYEDGDEVEILKVSGLGGRAYYDSGYESALDYVSYHEFMDYYNKNRLDYCTLSGN